MGEIVAGSRVMVRLEAEAEDHDWPEGCASFADVFGDADAAEPDEGFEAGTVIRLDEDGETPIALVVWDGLADCAEDADGDGMPSVWAWRVPLFALMPHGSCRSRFERLVDPVRQIATAIGTPAHVDPLADLPGLVLAVQAVVQRAESRDIAFNDLARMNTQLRVQAESTTAGVESRVADAVAAERMAIGAFIRATKATPSSVARSIEHGYHIDDDAPPLPSLRMVMLARDEAHKMLTRRADEVERQAARIRELFDENCALRAELDKRTAPHCQHAGDPGHDEGYGVHPDRGGPSVLDAEIERLTADRDRRIDPVEHARAVAQAFGVDDDQTDLYRDPVWLGSPVRAALLTRVGPDVLAEVER